MTKARVMRVAVMLLLFLTSGIGSQVVHAQNSQTFYLVYVDKSRSTPTDGLNDNLLSQLNDEITGIEGSNSPFVLFVSNGTQYNITDSKKSTDKILKSLYGFYASYPNQYYDIRKMRKLVNEKLANFSGTIQIDYYISNRLCKEFSERLSPLVSFLPQELASITNKKCKIIFNIYYPKTENTVNENTLRSAAKFYSTDKYSNTLDFAVKNVN